MSGGIFCCSQAIKKLLFQQELFYKNLSQNYLDFLEEELDLQAADFVLQEVLLLEAVFLVEEDLLQVFDLQLENCSTAIAQKYSS